MNRMLGILTLALAFQAGAFEARADEREDLKSAIRKLSEQANYHWTLQVNNAGQTGERFAYGSSEGRRERGGLTWIVTKDEPPIEAVIKGGKMAINSTDGWLLEQDLSAGDARLRHPRTLAIARTLKNHKVPAGEAEDLLKKSKSLTSSSEGYFTSGLTPDDARELIRRVTRTGASKPEISESRGTLAFWVRDGILAKYEFHLEGNLTYATAEKAWAIQSTFTVEVSGLGSTRIDLPEDVRKKLD